MLSRILSAKFVFDPVRTSGALQNPPDIAERQMNGYRRRPSPELFRWYRVRANHEAVAMTASSVQGNGRPELEIIFSSRDGYVWASWPDGDPVNLGRHEVVAAMMQDFLAQDALGKRLAMRHSDGI